MKANLCKSVYEEWCEKSREHLFVLTKGRIVLEQFDAVNKLHVTLDNLFINKRRVMVYSGVTFPDFVAKTKDKKEKDLIHGLPLWLPDKMVVDNKGTVDKSVIIDEKFMFKKMSTKKEYGGNKEKFVKGKNCYVNGAIYDKVDPDRVAVFDVSNIGSFDIQFDMVGVTSCKTTVQVRRAPKDCELINNAHKIALKLASMKGNVRNLWYGVGKMISIGERKDGKAYITNNQFNEAEPSSITVEEFGKMASATIKTKFSRTYKSMSLLEYNAEFQSYIGSTVHSLDASINLGNASHYDNCDIGSGVGIWVSKSGTDLVNWYFCLPNASVHGKKGVAIRLRHGIMIQWNGAHIKHCTMDPGYISEDEALIGLLLAPKKRFGENASSRATDCLCADPKMMIKYHHLFK